MQIDIFDVGHGACAVVSSPNGRRMMIDCGTNPDRSWRPSVHFSNQNIDVLAISNFDEDHATDFSHLHNFCTVLRYQMNNSISSDALSGMKSENGMGPGIRAIYNVLATTGHSSLLDPFDFSPIRYRTYYNIYGQDFVDPNNLSLVLIIEYAGFKIIFPGDLEKAGWRRLLEDQNFVNDLSGITVFVASHHGRESGCCDEVFKLCSPLITIMSDRDKQFDSQETVPWYRQRSTGILYDSQNKYVFTTRNNGHINIRVDANGLGIISAER